MNQEKHYRPTIGKGIYCNRTLNLKSIKAIGYDMDYTLIHYHVEEWEERAFSYLKDKLLAMKWPVEDAKFDPSSTMRGLIIDTELGNIVKANRFGYVKRAFHGNQPLSFEEQRLSYGRETIDLNDRRWVFLNTFFSISEAVMYSYLVDLLDQKKLPGKMGYRTLYNTVRVSLGAAHVEGLLKKEIMADPKRFVELDKDLPLVLQDQRESGKKLLLITNSDYVFTNSMMSYAMDSFLAKGQTWKDLFDIIIVSAQKPQFFSEARPLFKVVNDRGMLQECPMGFDSDHKIYLGGNAMMVETAIGSQGSDILFVGDHTYSDVQASKSVLRWRTALIMREIEKELQCQYSFRDEQNKLSHLMKQKEVIELKISHIKTQLMRLKAGYGGKMVGTESQFMGQMKALQKELASLDEEITPIAIKSGELYNSEWGSLMRTGNDKSYLARQVERHADIYTSRVSNFIFQTPYGFIRSDRGTLPHDDMELI